MTASDPLDSFPRRIRYAWTHKGWLRPFRNAGLLALGGGAQGLIQLLAIALASQTLGAAGFGTLVLVDTARRFVGGLLRLRSKEVVMRYGARALQGGVANAFSRVLAFAVWLDIISALVGLSAIVLAMGAAVEWLNMEPALADEARIYGLCVVFVALSSSAEAVLRLFDRFDLVAARSVIAPSIQVAGGAIGFALGAGLTYFFVVWFVAYALARLTLIGMALWELGRRGRLRELSLHPRCLAGPERGVWRFAIGTNVLRSLGKMREHGTMFAVGALLDPAAAGLVHIAQRLGKMPAKPVGKVLKPAFFPEIAHQTAAGKHRKRRKTVWRSTTIVGAFGLLTFLILVLFGKWLLAVMFGPSFADAYPVMLLFGLAGVIRALMFAMGPVLLSAGRVRIMLLVGAPMTAAQLGLLFLLVPQLGLTGTGLAELAAVAAVALVIVPAARHELRYPRDATPASGASPSRHGDV